MYNCRMTIQREIAYCEAIVPIKIERESLNHRITITVGDGDKFEVNPEVLRNVRGGNSYFEESGVPELTDLANRCKPRSQGQAGKCSNCILEKMAS